MLLELLKSQKYLKLDDELNTLQSQFESGETSEQELIDTYKTFEAKDESIESCLNEWVEFYPQSYPAHLARGSYLVGLGWQQRGHSRAMDVSENQWGSMYGSFSQAYKDLESSIHLTTKPLLSFIHLMNIEMTAGGENKNENIESLYSSALHCQPNSFEARKQKLRTIRPEWGGSVKQMEAFSSDKSHTLLSDEHQTELKAFRHFYEGHWLQGFQNDLENSAEAFSRAIELLPKGHFYGRRAVSYGLLGRIREAEEDLDKTTKFELNAWENQEVASGYSVLGYMYSIHKKPYRAVVYLERSLLLDPENSATKSFLALRYYYHNPWNKRALQLISEALQDNDKDAQAWKNLFDKNLFTWIKFHLIHLFSQRYKNFIG